MLMQMFLLPLVLEFFCKLGTSVHTTTVLERRLSYGPRDQDFGQVFEILMVLFVAFIVSLLLSIVGSMTFACLYDSKVVRSRANLPPEGIQCARPTGDFAMELFSCFNDTPTCMHALFCPACRAGDTYQVAGVSSYWNVIGLYVSCQVLGSLIGVVLRGMQDQESLSSGNDVGNLITSVLLGLAFYNMRRQLRGKLGGQEDASPCIQDFIFWAFCGCCVIAQEARSVDMATGVRVECCCNLVPYAIRGALVGNPVVGTPVQGSPLQGYPIQAQPGSVPGQQALHGDQDGQYAVQGHPNRQQVIS